MSVRIVDIRHKDDKPLPTNGLPDSRRFWENAFTLNEARQDSVGRGRDVFECLVEALSSPTPDIHIFLQ